MAVIALPAWAGSIVWIGAPDPMLAPGLEEVPISQVLPDPAWCAEDDAVSRRLVSELEEVRALVDEFDGELAIMSRLQAAIGDVRVLRNESDRAVLYRALLFQGFAVARYFQEDLSSDPGAADYRTMALGGVDVRPWVDAIALMPEEGLLEEYVPGPDQARAFDALRARARAAPAATVQCPGLEGQVCFVDARPTDDQGAVVPGLHYLSMREGINRTLWTVALRVRLEPGQKYALQRGVVLADFQKALKALQNGEREVSLSDEVTRSMLQLDGPVHIGVTTSRGAKLYVLDGRVLRRTKAPKVAPVGVGFNANGREVFASLGGGWMTNPDWVLLNDTVASSVGAANAPVLIGSLAFGSNIGSLNVGGGVDALLPLGAEHTLPVGSTQTREQVHPHLFMGLPMAQLTVGALLPWHLGLGVRLRQPITEGLHLSVGYIHGLGLSRSRGGVSPTFEPAEVDMAWASVGASWGL